MIQRFGSVGLTQLIIDPDNLGIPGKPQTPLVVRARAAGNFGFVPDLSICKPGDLILSFDRTGDAMGGWITHAQEQAGFVNHDDTRWTHAAVFLYDDLIVEAVPWRRVRSRSLYEDVPGSILRVRRAPLETMMDSHCAEITRYKIALRALQMLGLRYSYFEAGRLGWRLISGLSDRASFLSFGSTVICSKVFYDAYADITLKGLQDCPLSAPVMPAHLSATPGLVDIQVPWLKLAID